MGHVVCIKGISSHFKRWPGFSPPGTPVTHPLVHTPFKEPGTAAPLQPLSTVCVRACINLRDTAKQGDIVSLLSCHGKLCTVTYPQRGGGSNHQRPHLHLFFSFFLFLFFFPCTVRLQRIRYTEVLDQRDSQDDIPSGVSVPCYGFVSMDTAFDREAGFLRNGMLSVSGPLPLC